MKQRLYWLMVIVMVLSMVLSACGGATPTAEVVETTAPVETEEVVEPTPLPEPTEVVLPIEDVLDAAYGAFLDNMVSYNSLKLAPFNESLVSDTPPFVLDVREESEVTEKGYIEGAVWVPIRSLLNDVTILPSFDTPVVIYCASGWRCTIGMAAMGALGYTDVKALKEDSYGGWVNAGYPVVTGQMPEAPMVLNAIEPDAQLLSALQASLNAIPEGFGGIAADKLNTALVETPDTILIDVRTQDEIDEQGAIDYPGVVFISLQEFVAERANWPVDKDAPITIYCGSGHRSTIAMEIMWSYGYTNVTSLKGGFGGWKSAGFATVGGIDPELGADTAWNVFLGNMVSYNTLKIADFNTMLVENPPFIIDVREEQEVLDNGYIEGAVWVPIRNLVDDVTILPSFDTPVVIYCASGWRCTIGMAAMGALGWTDVKALKDNSFTGWKDAGYPVVTGGTPEAPAALNAANPDPALLATMKTALNAIPQGFGVLTADNLNLALTETPEKVIIDVRTQDEVEEQGTIDAANVVVIPLQEFLTRKAEWPADKTTPISIYCGSGHRSTIAMTILWSYGYTTVDSLKGGFAAWKDAGYPVALP